MFKSKGITTHLVDRSCHLVQVQRSALLIFVDYLKHTSLVMTYVCYMKFEEYLHSKNIDPLAFKTKEESKYCSLEKVYDQIHPDSFSSQKLFLINPLRRKYTWEESTKSVEAKPLMKPKIAKPKR